MNNRRALYLVAGVAVFALLASGCTKQTTNTEFTNTSVNQAGESNAHGADTNDPEGTIVVEAGDGVLSGAEESSMDYIKESARGLEAYLGSKGATATYSVTAPATGTYKLSVKLSDDGTWANGSRDATITVNGVVVMTYYHSSEDTKGWKWYTVGNASLKEGENTISFAKSNDMPAAFVMDEFKFVPVIL